MKHNQLLSPYLKRIRHDRTTIALVGFSLLTALAVVRVFVAGSWFFKVLLLLFAVCAAVYCWLLLESLRITPKPVQEDLVTSPTEEMPDVQAEDDGLVIAETGDAAGQSKEMLDVQAIDESSTIADNDAMEDNPDEIVQKGGFVFVSNKGNKYHVDRDCFGLRFADNIDEMTEEQAISIERKPCSKCCPNTQAE